MTKLTITKRFIEDCLKDAGAELIQDEAKIAMQLDAENYIRQLSRLVVLMTKQANRKTVKKSDVEAATGAILKE